jgi:hypothetical protein
MPFVIVEPHRNGTLLLRGNGREIADAVGPSDVVFVREGCIIADSEVDRIVGSLSLAGVVVRRYDIGDETLRKPSRLIECQHQGCTRPAWRAVRFCDTHL